MLRALGHVGQSILSCRKEEWVYNEVVSRHWPENTGRSSVADVDPFPSHESDVVIPFKFLSVLGRDLHIVADDDGEQSS